VRLTIFGTIICKHEYHTEVLSVPSGWNPPKTFVYFFLEERADKSSPSAPQALIIAQTDSVQRGDRVFFALSQNSELLAECYK
jgi:hypothetical protein